MPFNPGRYAHMSSRSYPHSGSNYSSFESATRRHELTAVGFAGTPAALLANDYLAGTLLAFKRTFNPAIADTQPTPDASNNFQNSNVMNGSRVENFRSKYTIKNISSTIPAILDVYMVALSYYDAFIWDSIKPLASPVTFSQVANLEGEVNNKAILAAQISTNEIKNFKFLQHYIKYKGQIELGTVGASDSMIQIDINDVPPQCRRSQTGMFWAVYLQNNTAKNAAATLALATTREFSFDEIPSDRRLPFIE